ncbi:restriction endonuclease [Nostoc sp. FACHB-152]|uniref:McrC family protein n=1 Tax=Nostoc sp. FACHB-152 TaxID=2692837 RepID=UPI00168286EA|nr:restriction endonuclease [Nostoc sp. FACHB-152]MBD2450542.1 restriction endonuclease [Nostoc sp. FACHB-152]
MSVTSPQIIELTEYVPKLLPRSLFPDAVGEMLWRDYDTQVSIDFPSPKTGDRWRLTAQGWVGHIPLTSDFHIALHPKVKLGNLLRMLEYAYDLKSFRFLSGLVDCQTLLEFYERLADILARRILNRGRQGFYCAYIPNTEHLPYVRGRIDVRLLVTRPWDTKIQCHYEEHTADVEENQILAWTLWCIARSGLCTERVMPTVRRAYHLLQGFVTLQPCNPRTCVGRQYNRLNEDYRPLHALCRFFLEQIAPSHKTGTHATLPFLVNMSQLYECFVAEWLKAHRETVLLTLALDIQSQERVYLGQCKALYFDIDLILYDMATGLARYVLDTKYKAASKPTTADINQMVAYAEAKGCQEAILIYPVPLAEPLNIKVGNIQIRSLTFSLVGDLEQAGYRFLQDLLGTEVR